MKVSKRKGKEMTTENTSTNTTSNVLPSLTPEQVAENFVKANTTTGIVDEFVRNWKEIEGLRKRVEAEASTADHYRQTLTRKLDIVEEFIKSHVGENDEASVDDLKELADSLDIELTKTIKVTFTAEVEVEMTVPLDFDTDDISESDFTVSAEFNGMTDVEVEDTNINIPDFEVEED